jgi:Protein of unknown function (DUF3224)
MSNASTATFQVTGWDETTIDEGPGGGGGGGKVTRATATRTFEGDIEGQSVVDYLMAYAADGSATFVGLERISGGAAGRKGTLVVQHVGRFEGGAATAALTVVPGAGSGDLAGASGDGEFYAPDMGGSVTLALTFAG